jgi:hypothetical protein
MIGGWLKQLQSTWLSRAWQIFWLIGRPQGPSTEVVMFRFVSSKLAMCRRLPSRPALLNFLNDHTAPQKLDPPQISRDRRGGFRSHLLSRRAARGGGQGAQAERAVPHV